MAGEKIVAHAHVHSDVGIGKGAGIPPEDQHRARVILTLALNRTDPGADDARGGIMGRTQPRPNL